MKSDFRILYWMIACFLSVFCPVVIYCYGTSGQYWIDAVLLLITFVLKPRWQIVFSGYDDMNDRYVTRSKWYRSYNQSTEARKYMVYRRVTANFRAHPVYASGYHDDVMIVTSAEVVRLYIILDVLRRLRTVLSS